MNNSKRFVKLVRSAKTILISTHIMPDADGIGGQIALFYALKSLKKNVFCICEESLPKKLQVIDKEGVTLSVKEFKEKNISKIDLAIVVDTNAPERTGAIFIDHHPCSQYLKKIHCIDTQASATGELVARLIQALGIRLTQKISLPLYFGILVDTSSFRYPTVSGDTHRVLGQLLDTGIKPPIAYNEIYGAKNLDHLKLLGEVLSSVSTTKSKELSWISVKQKDLTKYNVAADNTYSFINYLLVLENIQVACMFIELNGKIKVSLRSSGEIDVGIMAQALGGGGHNHSAATILKGNFDEVVKNTVLKIEKMLLGQ